MTLSVPSLATASHSRVDLLSVGPTGGGGTPDSFFEGASQDGARAFFSTTESLTSADTDSSSDVYQTVGGTTTLLSIGPNGGNGAFDAHFAGAAKDGTRVFFSTKESLTSSDTDSFADVYEASGGTTSLVSTGPNGGNGALDAVFDGASDDGTKVFFHTRESLLSADTDATQDVYQRSGGTTTRISFGGVGGNGAVDAFFGGSSADGNTVFFNTRESLTSADTDSSSDVYQRQGGTATTLISTGAGGGNAAFDALFEGASTTGGHAFFTTREKLDSGDTDDSIDIYDRSGSTTTLISTGPGQNVAGDAMFEGISSDGTHVFFSTDVQLVSGDTDLWIDIYERSGGSTTLESTGPSGGNGSFDADFAAASEDGSKLFFCTQESLTSGDNDANRDVYQRSGGATTLLSTGPAGGNGAKDSFFDGRSDDGSRVFFWTKESMVSSDTDSSGDVYERFGGTTTLISTGPAGGNGAFDAFLAGTSKDGAWAFFQSAEPLTASDSDGAIDLYRNVAVGTLVVGKDAQPDDPQDFSFSAGGGLSPTTFQLDDDLDPTLSNTRAFNDLLPGSGYSISETVPSGWNQSSATCDDGSSISNISISAGETVNCTFTNQRHGTIVVVENSQPDDPQDFSFTAGGGLSPGSFQLDDDSEPTLSNTRTFNDVSAGSGYSISETVPSGWDLTSSFCDDGSSLSNITVSPGEIVTCTLINRKRGKIVVVKDSQPNDPQDFSFTAGGGLSPGSFQLDDDSDPTLSNTRTFNDVTPSSGYSISETVPSGWDQSSATCDDGSLVSNISVSAAETVTCTFTNKKRGSILVVLDAIPNDPQNFSFTAGGGLSPTSFQLDDNPSPTLPNQQLFSNVQARSGYSLSQTIPSGWDLTSATCDNGSPLSDITVQPGQTVTCSFVDLKRGRINITKDAQPNDPQDFLFTAAGGLSPTSFQLDDDSDPTLSNSHSFINVVPQNGYSVSETAVAGWDLSSATCNDGSPATNIDVAPGETVTCTFTNEKRGQIVAVLDAMPNDPQDFSFTAGGGLSPTSFQLDDDSDPALSNSRTFANVVPGSGYSLSQTVPGGWDLTSSTCDDGSSLSNIDVSPGETVTCTFTDKIRGHVVVVKDAQPNDPQDFSFDASGGLSPTSFELDDDSDPTLSNTRSFEVSSGSGYSISETVPSGWDQSSATCNDGSPVTNIDVAPAETVTCTFTNRKRGQIVVVKDSQPNDPQDFSFTAGGGLSPTSFQLDDDSDPTLSNTRTFSGVASGSDYSISETVPSGWDQSSAICNDGSPVTNIDVAPAETVTCTFTNRKRGSIVVIEDAQPNDAQDFSFTAGGGLSPVSFQLDDDSDPTLSNTRTFANVVPASGYSLSQAVPSGWDLTSSTCNDGSSLSNIDVSPGETVTCTFTDRKRGQIVVVKDAQPNDPQDFSFTAGGGLSPSSFDLDDDSDPTLSNTRTFNDVAPGSGYSISETVPADWSQQSASCSDGSPVNDIDVAAGETVTCTFTNSLRPGTIIVKVDAVPDSPQDYSFTAGGGLSPASFQLDDDSDPALSNTHTFNNVSAGGGYSISETEPPDSYVTSASCDDGSPVSNIDVSIDETVTCTFVNQPFLHPLGASPTRLALVPAFEECEPAAANAVHAVPLIGSSCNPPAPRSSLVAVGSSSIGFVRLIVLAHSQCAAFDSTKCSPDFTIRFNVTDVRAGSPTGPDYNPSGNVDLIATAVLPSYSGPPATGVGAQITDKYNKLDTETSYDKAATVTPVSFPVPISCAATPTDPTQGSTCSALTTANSLVPGVAETGKRAIWETGQFRVLDQGANGTPGDSDDNVFEVQGVFVP